MRGKQLTTRSSVIETPRVPTTTRIRFAVARIQALRKRNYVEDLASKSTDGLASLSQDRKRLFIAAVAGLVLTSLNWTISLSFPYAISSVLWTGVNLQSRLLTILVMSVPFTPPFVTVFALSNLIFPSAPEPHVALDVMSTYEYRQTSDRRWLVIIVSAMLGALNCLLLGIALARATGN